MRAVSVVGAAAARRVCGRAGSEDANAQDLQCMPEGRAGSRRHDPGLTSSASTSCCDSSSSNRSCGVIRCVIEWRA